MRWDIDVAKVSDVYCRQSDKTGQAYAGVKVQEMGASHDFRIDPKDELKFRPFIGKTVKCSGSEIHEVHQFGKEMKKNITHHLDTMEELKFK